MPLARRNSHLRDIGLLVAGILIGSAVTVSFLSLIGQKSIISTVTVTSSVRSVSSSTSTNTSKTSVPVGAVLYLWYGYNYALGQYTGGLGTSHWNDSSVGVVKDKPLLANGSSGYYSSEEYVAQQLEMMRKAGLSYVVVSWWGWGITDFSNSSLINYGDAAIDAATKEVFSIVSEMNQDNVSAPPFRVVLLVDAFTNDPNYQEIYSYIQSNFYGPYENEVLSWQGRPLLLWFNSQPPIQNETLSSLDTNYGFNSRVIGNDPSQAQWVFWSAPQQYFDNYNANNLSSYVGNPVISSDGFVSITPRYDDYYLYASGGRSQYMRVGLNYSQGLYQDEWNYILKNNASVKLVLIYSWNEYHERSEIEPHYDYTSSINPYYLLDLTTNFVSALSSTRSISTLISFNSNSAVIFYSKLNTGLGMLTDTPNSTTIFLSDDQALDYSALMTLYNETQNQTALSLAKGVRTGIENWGGFFKYWNPVYEVIGSYPNSSEIMSGSNIAVGSSGLYSLKATKFLPNPNFDYSLYADQLAYRVLYYLHQGTYASAESTFLSLSKMWNGFGFVDYAYQGTYQSFKLALYLIAWKSLVSTRVTLEFASHFDPIVLNITTIMSGLQSNLGGVWTGYKFSNEQLMTGTDISGVNGETTSLFILS